MNRLSNTIRIRFAAVSAGKVARDGLRGEIVVAANVRFRY